MMTLHKDLSNDQVDCLEVLKLDFNTFYKMDWTKIGNASSRL